MPNWGQILEDTQRLHLDALRAAQNAADTIRRHYLEALAKYRKRNVIAYYSGFLSKPNVPQSEISDEDKNGFMRAVHELTKPDGLDLIIHTQGGGIAATQSIVDYLRKMFKKDIVAVVPQIAMSAGTILACSCKKILMCKHSNLGPIDPHLDGYPANGVKEEFKRAYKEIKHDPSMLYVWEPILKQYGPTFLGRCENATSWSNAFVREQLTDIMFAGQANAKTKASRIVRRLTSYKGNATHERHIHFEECEQMGLNVEQIEKDPKLQDLVLTVHHCYMHAFMNTNAYKIIENHKGAAIIRHVV